MEVHAAFVVIFGVAGIVVQSVAIAVANMVDVVMNAQGP